MKELSMNNLEKAKNLLLEKGYTCVLCKDYEIFSSEKRGVKPLIEFLETNKSFQGFSAADKTVGAGAAHIYALLEVEAVWANIISEEGERILRENNISVVYGKKVKYIINRAGNGQCPIESCVYGIHDSKEAYKKIKETISALVQGG